MNFDYEYVTTAAPGNGNVAAETLFVYIVIGMTAAALVVIASYFIMNIIKYQKKQSELRSLTGIVFCRKCDNKYDVTAVRCPYCKTKNIRKGMEYVRY